MWAAQTNLSFIEVNSASTADIVILWGSGSHGDPYPFDGINGVLAHAFYPPPNGGSLAGDVHLDDAETWTLNTRSSVAQPIDLMTVAAHEIGHSLGLAHSTTPGSLMYPYYTGSHRYLSPDDIAGIRYLYGTPLAVYLHNPECSYTPYTTHFSATADGGSTPYISYTFETKPICSGGELRGDSDSEKKDGVLANLGPSCDWSYGGGGTSTPSAAITRYEPYYVRVYVTDSQNNIAYSAPEYIPIYGSCTGANSQAFFSEIADDSQEDFFYHISSGTPNPFSDDTILHFTLPERSEVNLRIYDALGREVAQLAQGDYQAGHHSARFDAGSLPGGVYLFRFEATSEKRSFSRSGTLLLAR